MTSSKIYLYSNTVVNTLVLNLLEYSKIFSNGKRVLRRTKETL